MKRLINKTRFWGLTVAIVILLSCEDLTEVNKNPNAVDINDANINLMMPAILGPTATNYLSLGIENMAGAMQQIQRTGWSGGVNRFEWESEGWEKYYDILRDNKLMLDIATENNYTFHRGVGLTIRAFIFGQIADYWGDAPYSNALQGDEGDPALMFPDYDSQETIYDGIIADLTEAASLFATGDDNYVSSENDIYFDGDMEAWERFANSLAIRYLVRISPKKSDSKAKVEAIVQSGKYIQTSDQDATYDYTGGQDDLWPLQYDTETSSTRNLACKTFIDQLNATNDPRKEVWFAPVAVRWVEDELISGTDPDSLMRMDGVLTDIWTDWIDFQGRTETFTKHFNPDDVERDTNEFVGVPPGLLEPTVHKYNGETKGGQGRWNHHVSMLTRTFMDGNPTEGDLLQSRMISAAEVNFTLAEMKLQGWNVGEAQTLYENGIRSSLEAWGVEDQYDSFISEVAFDGTAGQILTQKWVASFTAATEAWNDYKRTGLPVMATLSELSVPVPAIRFGYGSDETNNNSDNVNEAIEKLEITEYSGSIGKNSVYSKTWLLQGLNVPY